MKSMDELKHDFRHLGKKVIDSCQSEANFVTGMSYDGRIPTGALERNFESNLKAAEEEDKKTDS